MSPILPSPFNEDGVQFAWDSTSINWAQTCLRMYQYNMIERWSPETKSPHLLFGGWYATALEHYHQHRAKELSHNEATHLVIHEALIATWDHDLDETGIPVPETGAPWQSIDNVKTRENLIRTIVWYLEEFQHSETKTLILNGTPAVEQTFAVEFADNLLLCGHMDRLVEYSGEYYVQDQKTTKTTLSPRFFEGFSPNTQMSAYTLAGQIILQSPVSGVMIDAAQIAVGFSRFERGFTFRTEQNLEEWRVDALHAIKQAQDATRNNYFPQNPASCHNYGGCAYRHVCARSPHVRPQFLKGSYIQRDQWNPLESR